MVAGAFVVAVVAFLGLRNEPDHTYSRRRSSPGSRPAASTSTSASWSTRCRSRWSLFVTGVGALIHLYSIGYMHGDQRFSQFFLYLNLFVFSMLMLVLGDNLLSPSSGGRAWACARTS